MLVQEILLENTPDRYVLHHTAEIDADGNKIYRTYDTHTKKYVKTFSGPNAKIDALNWSVDNNAEYRQQEYKKKQNKEETDKKKKEKQEKIKGSRENFRNIMSSKSLRHLFRLAIAFGVGNELHTYTKRYAKAYYLNGCTDKLITNNISPYTNRPIGKDIIYFKAKIEKILADLAVSIVEIIFAGTLLSLGGAFISAFIAISLGTFGTFVIVAAAAVALHWVAQSVIAEIISRDELEKIMHQQLGKIFWTALSAYGECEMPNFGITVGESIVNEQTQFDNLLDRLTKKIPNKFQYALEVLLNAKDSAKEILSTLAKWSKH